MDKTNKYIKIVYYGNFPYGGASANLVRYFSLALSLQGNNVEVVLPTGVSGGNKAEQILVRKGSIEQVRFRRLSYILHPRNPLGKLADYLIGSVNQIIYLFQQSLSGKLDLIIQYNTTVISTLILVIVKIILRKKLIIILPEFYEKPQGKKISFALIKWYDFYWGLSCISKKADGFITASHYLKAYALTHIKRNVRVMVLPNVMDPSVFECESKPFINAQITIGYTGTPTRKDGVGDLLLSFSKLHREFPMTHLLVIGDVFKGSVIPQLKEEAIKLGISDNVTFTGIVQFSDIPKLLRSCQILALTRPSGVFAEAGFPTKLGEYFACMRPVVITKVGDIPKYFKDQVHVILVNPDDIEDITRGFIKLLTDISLADYLCGNAYSWMIENLAYKQVSKKINEFIEVVLQR